MFPEVVYFLLLCNYCSCTGPFCFPPFLVPLFLPPTTLLIVHLMPLCPCPKAPWVASKNKGPDCWPGARDPGPISPKRSRGRWVLRLSGEHFVADEWFVCDVEMRPRTKAQPIFLSAWPDSQYFSRTRACSWSLVWPFTIVLEWHCGVRSTPSGGGAEVVSITKKLYQATKYKHHKNSFKSILIKAGDCVCGGGSLVDLTFGTSMHLLSLHNRKWTLNHRGSVPVRLSYTCLKTCAPAQVSDSCNKAWEISF